MKAGGMCFQVYHSEAKMACKTYTTLLKMCQPISRNWIQAYTLFSLKIHIISSDSCLFKPEI